MGEIITTASQIIQSPFALALVLMVTLYYAAVNIRKMVAHIRHELRIALLECREDALIDVKFNSSLLSAASKFQSIVIGLSGGQRQLPEHVEEMFHEFKELRRKMHDETERRAVRVAQARKVLEDKVEKEDLT